MSVDILLVDDEVEIMDLLEVYLQNEGFLIRKFHTAEEAFRSVEKAPPDLALLDVMLPDSDGFSLCRRIRENHTFPVIMLAAKVEDMDKIRGLSLGADDYITKPFNPLEVVARVKVQLRRARRYNEAPGIPSGVIDFSGLVINRDTHECTLYDKPLSLTPTEFNILWYLCENRGRVVPSEELFEKVWREKFLDCNNTVMVHIRRLREKMNEPSRHPRFIRTVWGVGYKIEG